MREGNNTFRTLPAAGRRAVLEAALREFAAHNYKSANTDAPEAVNAAIEAFLQTLPPAGREPNL